ncbi:MAG: AAA family ATPase [Spirochaetia bacterium]|nr:AAA family ATPase [Spirochaetia bacterium]
MLNPRNDAIIPYLPTRMLLKLAHDGKTTFKRMEKMEGVILFFDLSDFTPLTGALMQSGIHGAETLQEILREYYDLMISFVHKFGGSVYQFAGDSALVSFEKLDSESMEKAVFRVASCAEKMKQALQALKPVQAGGKTYNLQSKFSISHGNYYQIIIGSINSFFDAAITGIPVFEATQGEKVAIAMETILSKNTADILQDKAEIVLENGVYKLTALKETHADLNIDLPVFDSSSRDLLEKARHFIAPALFDKITLGSSGLIAEIREVTSVFILFGDIDFESNSKEAADRVNLFFDHIQTISKQYGGLLVQTDFADKGNVLLVLFGAPVAIEQKELMAVRFASKILEIAKDLSFLTKLQIGISTGKNYCGDVGASTRKGYTVLGESVNFAARLMSYTQNFTACLDTFTHAKISGNFEFKQISDVSLKGIQAKNTLYQVLSEKKLVTVKQSEEKFIGRKSEMSQLIDRIENSHQTPYTILMIGDTGVGKTRLASAVIEEVRDHIILSSACFPYEKFTPFFAWRKIYEGLFNIKSLRSDEEKINKISNELSKLEGVNKKWGSIFSMICGLKIDKEDPFTAELDPKQKNERISQITLQMIASIAQKKSLLIAIDDFHVIDEASLLLIHFISANLPIKTSVLLIMRPEADTSSFEDISNLDKIKLKEFESGDAVEYLRYKLQLENENQEIENLIISRAHGNPLFIESIIHSLREQMILKLTEKGIYKLAGSIRDMVIPNTLQDVLLSRVDRLREGEQVTLKTASVFGRIFAHELIRHLAPPNLISSINDYLKTLESSEFIDINGLDPLTYVFKHILIRDVVYNSMLESTRKDLHNRLAQIIEAQYKENLDEVVDSLAYHYLLSGSFDLAYVYCLKAAYKSFSRYSNKDAIYYFEKALEILNNKNTPEFDSEVLNIQDGLAEAYAGLGQYDKSADLYEKTLPWRKTNLEKSKTLFGLGKVYREKGDLNIAVEKLEQALALVGKQVPASKIMLYASIGKNLATHEINNLLPFTVKKLKAQSSKKKILEHQSLILMNLDKIYFFIDVEKLAWSNFYNILIADKISEPSLKALSYANYGLLMAGMGFFKKSYKNYNKAILYSRPVENQIIKGIVYQRFGMMGMYTNKPDEWYDNMQKAVALFKDVSENFELFVSLMACGLANYFRSNHEQALENFIELKKIAEQHNAKIYIVWGSLYGAVCRYITGKIDAEEALSIIGGAQNESRDKNDLGSICTAWYFLLQIALHKKDLDLCEKFLNGAYADVTKLTLFMPDSHIVYTAIADAATYALENQTSSSKQYEQYIKKGLGKLLSWGKTFPYVNGPAHRALANYYHYKKNKGKARKLILKAIDIHEKGPNRMETGIAYLTGAKIIPEFREEYLQKAEKIFLETNSARELEQLRQIGN